MVLQIKNTAKRPSIQPCLQPTGLYSCLDDISEPTASIKVQLYVCSVSIIVVTYVVHHFSIGPFNLIRCCGLFYSQNCVVIVFTFFAFLVAAPQSECKSFVSSRIINLTDPLASLLLALALHRPLSTFATINIKWRCVFASVFHSFI